MSAAAEALRAVIMTDSRPPNIWKECKNLFLELIKSESYRRRGKGKSDKSLPLLLFFSSNQTKKKMKQQKLKTVNVALIETNLQSAEGGKSKAFKNSLKQRSGGGGVWESVGYFIFIFF